MQNYIITYTKNKFYPLNPEMTQIHIVDIAHALSLITRAGGHFPEFYSVAQHSINCANEAIAREYSNQVILGCLLHDASEAYLADITRPVKQHLDQYMEYEAVLQTMIYQKYLPQDLTKQEEQRIKEIDDMMLYYEFKHYTEIELFECTSKMQSRPDFTVASMKSIENQYLKMFEHNCDTYLDDVMDSISNASLNDFF